MSTDHYTLLVPGGPPRHLSDAMCAALVSGCDGSLRNGRSSNRVARPCAEPSGPLRARNSNVSIRGREHVLKSFGSTSGSTPVDAQLLLDAVPPVSTCRHFSSRLKLGDRNGETIASSSLETRASTSDTGIFRASCRPLTTWPLVPLNTPS